MNILKKTLRIPKNRELKIKIPKTFDVDQKVTILIEEDKTDNYKKKIEIMKKSLNDEAFQKDMKEVSDDFDAIDSESLN